MTNSPFLFLDLRPRSSLPFDIRRNSFIAIRSSMLANLPTVAGCLAHLNSCFELLRLGQCESGLESGKRVLRISLQLSEYESDGLSCYFYSKERSWSDAYGSSHFQARRARFLRELKSLLECRNALLTSERLPNVRGLLDVKLIAEIP